MSVDEAKKVSTSFTGTAFVPPPRTITDVRVLLEPTTAAATQVRQDQIAAAATVGELAPSEVAIFYRGRGYAARRLGRIKQALDDFKAANEVLVQHPELRVRIMDGDRGPFDLDLLLIRDLAETEATMGNHRQAIERYERATAIAIDRNEEGYLFQFYAALGSLHATTGDLRSAERVLDEVDALRTGSASWRLTPDQRAQFESHVAATKATVLELRGRLTEAEKYWREAIAVLVPVERYRRFGGWTDERTSRLAICLMRQGRLIEAEVEARKAIRSAAGRAGGATFGNAPLVTPLIRILREQGRYPEAEMLARMLIEMFEREGASAVSSPVVSGPRRQLAAIVAAQGRWDEARQEYATVRVQISDDRLFREITQGDLALAMTLMKTGQSQEASEILETALQRAIRIGGEDAAAMEIRGLLAASLATRGDTARALTEFARATAGLLERSPESDDESAIRPERERRLRWILSNYIDVLSQGEGDVSGAIPLDAAREAFRLADAARGRVVDSALGAAAARSVVTTPALADLIRRQQDSAKQIGALRGLMVAAFDGPDASKVVSDLRERIGSLQQARQTLTQQIARECPAYSQLVNPPPTTVEQARSALRPGEALLATYVADDWTFVWAIPHAGPMAFARVPLGREAMATIVSELRQALDPGARTLGDLPPFDVAKAHALYRQLLEPVRKGWQAATSLLIVTSGPLGEVPFGLLPTAPVTLAAETAPLFANYQAVPWLIRTHAVTVLPSVTSLVTLRGLPAGDATRRAFAGFGDPYFSIEQARRAAAEVVLPAPDTMVAMAVRARPIVVRDLKISKSDSVSLAVLPRLPDTAAEIRDIALALNADFTRDVFLGARATEKAVKATDLTRYRVVAFATHGLVPGDLDGLTQPALALTTPELGDTDGDGLLTMAEILALRLNADWVVLSACNTASGQEAGAEAISGLGRAFFYAGARALLVSNWPVETASARILTTDLFRRQGADPKLTRAEALQQTLNALIDSGSYTDPQSKQIVFSYAHPIFWAPFSLVGDGGR